MLRESEHVASVQSMWLSHPEMALLIPFGKQTDNLSTDIKRKTTCECSKQIGLSLFASSAMTQGPSCQNGPVMHNMFNTLASNYTIYRENSHSTCFQVLNRFTAKKKDVTLCHIVLTTSHSDLFRPHKLQC